MRKESSLPVRLDTDAKLRLQEIGEAMGLTVSALVRLLIKSFVQSYDSNGGKITLPLSWSASDSGKEKIVKRAVTLKKVAPKTVKKTRSR